MRPLRLEIRGFTAFRDPAEIDFTKLDVFAIAGPTGSGKSSLLDAMTYALYGRVERVGDRVGQLISQGQPRMAVTLEFEIGRERYRIARSTPAKGATKILVQRRDPGGKWGQVGEGADRVREAERWIQRTVGLSYDGFTRSVLLPQGKFAEFLVGDPRKRRDILTELLGLSLFRRMAERAGAKAKELAVSARTMADVLAREYADATPGSLKEAKQAARGARKHELALGRAAERVVEILARWRDAERSLEELDACAEEASRVAVMARKADAELRGLEGQLAAMAGEVERAHASEKEARAAVLAARAALDRTIGIAGSAQDLMNALPSAQRLAEARTVGASKERDLAQLRRSAGMLAQAVEDSQRELAESLRAVTERESEMLLAETGLEEARHVDLVAAVSAGLGLGDPCPVCGVALEHAPKGSDPEAFIRAEKALAEARSVLNLAEGKRRAAERVRDAAAHEFAVNESHQEQFCAELKELSARVATEEEALATHLGIPLPSDPAAALEERLSELRLLDLAEREAASAQAKAENELLSAKRDHDQAAAQVARLGDRLNVHPRRLFERTDRAAGMKLSPAEFPTLTGLADVPSLRRYAADLGDTFEAFSNQVGMEVDRRRAMEHTLLEQANMEVGELVGPEETLEALARATEFAMRAATADAAKALQRAEDLALRVEGRRQLEDEAARLERRAAVFRRLALEVRADRLIAFLQAEALQVLAAAGSDRMASLSDGRYRIVCDADEFLVIDTWNGEEERSARTLSGGETFVVSLALALALADQVRSLSITDRARLDSLFLDEGFGTLDQEALRLVVEAIEQLAGDGRLVGVVTHVRELAEQFPRIEVRKSARGSSLELVA